MEDLSSHLRRSPPHTTPASPFPSLMDAVKEFACMTLVAIPADWIADALRSRDRPAAMPMCASLFLVQGPWQVRAIRNQMSSFDFGDDFDRQRLVDAGWQVIPETGLFVYDLDGYLLVGVDGIGYDFFDAHWRPLYEVLGLRWHLDD
ncbi:hypothetical protein [Novipirellula maiorica]|nr:hypothetical protein [Rhodopirellula maiorica]